MDINYDKKKILCIYNEISCFTLYKKAKTVDKILFFILSIVILAITCTLCILENIFHMNILSLISLIVLISFFICFDKMYGLYIKREYKLRNIDGYYHFFIKNLKKHKIKDSQIKYYIDLLELGKDSPNNTKTGFFEWLLPIFISGIMIYFNDEFSKAVTIAYLSVGLVVVPMIIFFIKIIFNRNKIKYDLILQYLKRRNIELTVYK